ncbi:MAG: hypothetical protein FWF68_04405 [Spirochaetes bacterium]|nr:hypothetical protein [Brevinematales bacterium]MCL1958822.1 hypothetical protein [Spirochaetota bacterium]
MNRDSKNPITLFASNPWFSIDFDILKDKGIIKRIGNKYLWTKSKTSLAEYFCKNRDSNKTYTPGGFWAPIEYFFLINGKPIKRGSLRKLAGKNANLLKPDKSEDFKEIKKIVMEYRREVEHQEKEQRKLQDKLQSIAEIINNVYDTRDIKTLLAAKEKIQKILA